MHLHHCGCLQEHVRMVLQSLRALCKAREWAGSIWKYLEALAMAAGVSDRLANGFWTEIHFADIYANQLQMCYSGVNAFGFIRMWIANQWRIGSCIRRNVAMNVCYCRFSEPSLIWLLPGRRVPAVIYNCPLTISRVCIYSAKYIGDGVAAVVSTWCLTTTRTFNSAVPYLISLWRK